MRRIICIILLGLVVAGCGRLTGAREGTAPGISATATSHGTMPTPAPTKPPTPDVGPAVLGGNIVAFTKIYGQPNDRSGTGVMHYARYPDTPGQPDSGDDAVIATLGWWGSQQERQNVMGVTHQANLSVGYWTFATAQGECRGFLPADARQQRMLKVKDDTGTVVATVFVYDSRWLASRFPTAAFTDSNRNPVTPGTFDVKYLYQTGNSNQVEQCDLSVGQQEDTWP